MCLHWPYAAIHPSLPSSGGQGAVQESPPLACPALPTAAEQELRLQFLQRRERWIADLVRTGSKRRGSWALQCCCWCRAGPGACLWLNRGLEEASARATSKCAPWGCPRPCMHKEESLAQEPPGPCGVHTYSMHEKYGPSVK